MMNVKQAAGLMLLMVMLMIAYGLFGGGTINKSQAVMPVVQENITKTPEISVSHYDYETHATVDIGCVLVMVILMIITSWGQIPHMRMAPEKGSKEELEELESEEPI